MGHELLLLEASAPPLEEEYEPRLTWFDAQHQHFLLLKSSVFSLWRVAEVPAGSGAQQQSPYPTFLHNDSTSLSQSLASLVKTATASVDLGLLALQISNTRVVVVDIASHKRWTVDIKSSETSTIIRNGIIWSDHGGNSQDLILVTNRGLEMYKISSQRSQCKLSRHLPHDILHFWYEPTHRMLLLQVRSKHRKSVGGEEAPYMTGYFLKTDKSDSFPMLELPPPDRIPKFQLEAELQRPDNVSLVSVYGRLYCAFYSRNSTAGPALVLYLVTKTHVPLSHVLTLGRSPEVVSLSVVDDLLAAHFTDVAGCASVLFDIASAPPLRWETSLCSAPRAGAAAAPRDECYGHKWCFLPPGMLWDRWNGRVYSLRCALRGLSRSLHDAPAALTFLSRRGRSRSGAYCAEAKQLMIDRLRELHSSKVGLSWLETAYSAIAEPYGNVCKAAAADAGEQSGSADLRRKLMGIFTSDADASSSARSPDKVQAQARLLEDPESFYAFLPHLATIAGKCLDRPGIPSADQCDKALSVRRDALGSLVLTQSELLSHVWLPLASTALGGSAADAEYCSWAMSMCISCYRGAGAPVHPALSILLLNTLARMRKYTDAVRLLQAQFFPDSSDLAVSALQLADTVEDEALPGMEAEQAMCDKEFEERSRARSAVASLRQMALDMLWRVDEHETVVRWLLGHGLTLDALTLLRRCQPDWQRDGFRSGITAAEVFSSAVLALRFVGNEDFDDLACFAAAELAGGRVERGSTTSRDSLGSAGQSGDSGKIRRISITLCPSGLEKTVESERAEIMFTVQRFLAQWYKDSLLRSGPTALSAQTSFPDELFDSVQAMKFRKLFGFV